jgi:hypothetical protein
MAASKSRRPRVELCRNYPPKTNYFTAIGDHMIAMRTVLAVERQEKSHVIQERRNAYMRHRFRNDRLAISKAACSQLSASLLAAADNR